MKKEWKRTNDPHALMTDSWIGLWLVALKFNHRFSFIALFFSSVHILTPPTQLPLSFKSSRRGRHCGKIIQKKEKKYWPRKRFFFFKKIFWWGSNLGSSLYWFLLLGFQYHPLSPLLYSMVLIILVPQLFFYC